MFVQNKKLTMTKTDRNTAGNSGFALWGLTCFVETFVQGSTFVLRMNSRAKIPHNAKPQPVSSNPVRHFPFT